MNNKIISSNKIKISLIIFSVLIGLCFTQSMAFADTNDTRETELIAVVKTQMSEPTVFAGENQNSIRVSPMAYLYKDWFYWYHTGDLNFNFPSQVYIDTVPTGLYDTSGNPIYYQGWLDYQHEVVYYEGGYIDGVWFPQYKQAYYSGTLFAWVN